MSQMVRKFIGDVKWFDVKKGYGFIQNVQPIDVEFQDGDVLTQIDTWDPKEDIFCHYLSISKNVKNTNDDYNKVGTFKTLEPNDKVQFVIHVVEVKDKGPKKQAVDIVVLSDVNIE